MALACALSLPAFARNLRYYRRRHHYSQAHLAHQAGCSRQTISALERGTNDPSVPLLLDLARALGLDSLDPLLRGDQPLC